MINKYRIIEPKLEENTYGGYRFKGNGDNKVFYSSGNNEFIDAEMKPLFKVGDIVDFEQVEKWIEIGLQPMYFVEEVLYIEYTPNIEYGEYCNLKEAKKKCIKNANAHDRIENIILHGEFVNDISDDFLIKFENIEKDLKERKMFDDVCFIKQEFKRNNDFYKS